MSKLRQAAWQALWALEDIFGKEKVDVGAINALRAALAEPEPVPFGFFQYSPHLDAWVQNRSANIGTAFYVEPKQPRPLTEPQLHEINPTWPAPGQHWEYEDVLAFARAIERAHGIGVANGTNPKNVR